MHTGSEGCAVAFLFVSASKSTSSCRLQGLLGVSERAVCFLPSACAKVALRKPRRLWPRLNNTVAMTSLMGSWTLPQWWIGTCQTGKLCTTGLDCMLSLSLSLSLVLPPAPLLSFPSLSALQANVLAELQASCCQIGGPYSCWQRLRQWLRKERGEDKREREWVGEKRSKKSSSTWVCQRSCELVQHWFGSLFFLPVFCALH